jgi:hypothetical protein
MTNIAVPCDEQRFGVEGKTVAVSVLCRTGEERELPLWVALVHVFLASLHLTQGAELDVTPVALAT